MSSTKISSKTIRNIYAYTARQWKFLSQVTRIAYIYTNDDIDINHSVSSHHITSQIQNCWWFEIP